MINPQRILICGDRNWPNPTAIGRAIDNYTGNISLILHGGCCGADRLAGIMAKSRGIPVKVYPAQWDVHGRAAGYIRNQQMFVDGHPDEVWAFHPNLSYSKGTAHIVSIARDAGILTTIFNT